MAAKLLPTVASRTMSTARTTEAASSDSTSVARTTAPTESMTVSIVFVIDFAPRSCSSMARRR